MKESFASYPQERRVNAKPKNIGGGAMRAHYDFSKMKGEKNPYIAMLKQSITIRIDRGTVSYFKTLALQVGMPYQNLINLYLRECAENRKRPQFQWTVGEKVMRYGAPSPRTRYRRK
jgi:hypothetical protein